MEIEDVGRDAAALPRGSKGNPTREATLCRVFESFKSSEGVIIIHYERLRLWIVQIARMISRFSSFVLVILRL